MASRALRIAIAGLGTVGANVFRLLREENRYFEHRYGVEIEPVAVSARHRDRDRGISLDGVAWVDNPLHLADDSSIDVVVELIGGADGPALALVERAIAARKPIVTANKALLATHGFRLAAQAEEAGVPIAYEAAVAGGIPIIKHLREGLAANHIQQLHGILNGTSNFILSEMQQKGSEFSEALQEAQSLGYAEADPSFDIDGIDAAHKLSILTSLAFHCRPDFGAIRVEGIRQVRAVDIAYAEELGYTIKLLAVARRVGDCLEQRVQPAMVSKSSPIAAVNGVFNGIVAQGSRVGQSIIEGRGAGGEPTASAVCADLVDLALGRANPVFGLMTSRLSVLRPLPRDEHIGSYYVRFMVQDRPGVIADIAAALRDAEVSIEALLQRGRSSSEAVPIVMTTHDAREAAIRQALERIAKLPTVVEPPHLIPIEAL